MSQYWDSFWRTRYLLRLLYNAVHSQYDTSLDQHWIWFTHFNKDCKYYKIYSYWSVLLLGCSVTNKCFCNVHCSFWRDNYKYFCTCLCKLQSLKSPPNMWSLLCLMMYNFFFALDLQNLTLYDQREFQTSCCDDLKQRDEFVRVNVMNTASFKGAYLLH